MSPAQNPSGRPSPYTLTDQVASSNSTANRFLGASQKPWMTSTPSSPLSIRSDRRKLSSSTSNQLVVTASAPAKPSQVSPGRENTTHSNPITAQPLLTQPRSRIPPESLPSLSVRVSHHTPAQNTPVSPLTPGTRLSESENDRQVSQAPNVPKLDFPPSKATFPTPEPSNSSLTSPVAVTEGGDLPVGSPAIDAPLIVAVQALSVPKAGDGRSSTAIKREGGSVAATATPLPAADSLSPSVKSRPALSHRPQLQTPSRYVGNRQEFWHQARETLRSFLSSSTRCPALSETVELPRIRILQDACSSKDMFYLALHQTFCLSSLSPVQLQQVLQFGIRPDRGFDVIAQLLVDNKRLSTDFVRWSANYPSAFEAMLELKEYKDVLMQVSTCLDMISKNWTAFENDLRIRGHPPQVDELVVRLGVVSPVLQTIVFTAVSRRLFGPREDVFKACMSLFEEDQKTYPQRFASSAASKHQAMFEYFEKYKQICASYGVIRKANRSRKPSALSLPTARLPTTTSSNTSPGLIVQENQVLHGVSINDPFRPPPNSQINSYPHPPRPIPNQYVPSNMASNIDPQQRQQLHQQSLTGNPPKSQKIKLQHFLLSSQPAVFLPPHPFLSSSQGNAPVNGSPGQPPSPHVPNHPYLPQGIRRASDGTFPSVNSPGQPCNVVTNAVNMGPASNPPYSPVYPSYLIGQPPPPNGPGQRPTSSGTIPQPHVANVAASSQSVIRHSSRLPPQSTSSFPPSSPVQPNGAPFAFVPFLPSNSSQQAMPRPAPALPVQSSPVMESSPEIIQYFSDFSIPPQKLPRNRSVFTWKFSVSKESLRLRPHVVMQPNGRGYTPVLADGNISYRLRCVRYEGFLDLGSVVAWSQAENHWPDVVYIHVNNIEIYRSTNSKNLPLSINAYLKEGANEIRLNVLHNSQHRAKDVVYAVAVENLCAKGIGSFKSLVKTLSAKESRRQIQDRLSISGNDDDELMIVDDFISIDLRDPFTTRIFDVPVRGLLCTHRECFDLSTFLQTLLVKPSSGKRTLYVRCPICRKDARPSLLIIDEFLVEVKAALAQQNKLETAKALRVKMDGSWDAVLEVDTDAHNATSRKRDRTSFEADLIKTENSATSSILQSPAAPEVIELD